MAAKPVCSLCDQTHRDMYHVNGRKREEMRTVLLEIFPLYIKNMRQICDRCWKKMTNFLAFKRFVEKQLDDVKKRQVTPLKNTPKRRRISVAGNILKSIEKLPSACNKTPERIPVVTQLVSSIEKLKLGSGTLGAKPKKQLVFHEHSYAEKQRADTVGLKVTKGHAQDVKQLIEETTSAISLLSSTKTSILSVKRTESLFEDTLFSQTLNEMCLNVPFLYELLDSLVGETGNKKATMALIYAMILNSRNRRASAIQKYLTVLAVNCHADNKLLSRLNKLHLTMSSNSKKNLVDSFSEHCERRVVDAIRNGQDGKLNGDNVDIYVKTNDIRMKNKSKDYHFFATDWTPFRLTNEDFKKNDWLKTYVKSHIIEKQNLTNDMFTPDLVKFKSNIKVLVARQLTKIFPKQFKWMDLVVPAHIHHPLEEIMSRPTRSYTLPILLKNEMKYEDCISIMDSYNEQMSDWYRKAGRSDDFVDLKIPIGGDQLTRVRLDGAKTLRLGSHTPTERFDNLFPVIIEMFHMQMDFLEKLVKKFMKKSSGRDVGTLQNLQIQIQRTSVNGNVKSRFKAHEEFVFLVGKAYIAEAAMNYFGMQDLSSLPTKHEPPENIDTSHSTRRKAVFDEIMDGFLATVFGPFSFEECPSQDMVKLVVAGQVVNLPVQNGKVILIVQQQSGQTRIEIPKKLLEQQEVVKIEVCNLNINVQLMKPDDLQNYILNFLQYYFILINFKDAVREGDIFRVNNSLKLMIPFFYNHSPLSKYLVECLDYILKTEVLLPPKLAINIRCASFVNPRGAKSKNKPADMAKENQVRELKELIKGLGSNKNEKSIVTISKAYPVINDIVLNVDAQIGYKDVKSSHKSRSEEEDLKCLLKLLRKLNPFSQEDGRMLYRYHGVKRSVFIELLQQKNILEGSIIQIAYRLKCGIPVIDAEIEEKEDEFDTK